MAIATRPASPPARRGSRAPRRRGGGRHASPGPLTRGASQRNAAAARQPYGAARRSPVQVRRAEPVIIEPQKKLAGAPRVLIAEFLLCVVVVAAKPFEKSGADAKASEGTIGQFAAIMVLFFVLALFGGVSDRTQKAANLFGALITLGIIFKNTESLAAVASALQGSVKTPASPDTGAAANQSAGNEVAR
jgi:hypothetical protein